MRCKVIICLRCGHREKTEVFEPGERVPRDVHVGPPRCPKCKAIDVKLVDC